MSAEGVELGVAAEAAIAETLDKRENLLINAALAKLNAGGLTAEEALRSLMQVNEGRTLRRALIKRAEIEGTRHPQQL